MEIVVKEIVYGSAEYQSEIRLRTTILRDPLGLKFSPEELSREVKDIHLGAFSGALLLGCLVLSPQPESIMKMRQVAVAAGTQGLGVGRKLVESSEAKSRQLGFVELQLNAREVVVPFYLKLGYEVYGAPFDEVTIPHRKMKKSLSA